MFSQRSTASGGFIASSFWRALDSATGSIVDLNLQTTIGSAFGNAELWTYDAGGGETTTSASGGGTTQTSSADGTHTHDIEYAITDDTEHPQSITVSVNGVDKTLALFGSATLAGSNAAIDVIADADELTTLLQNASGGLRQEHEITIDCGSGQGRIEATVEIYEITQTIIVV
jgi:hypothetical protein